MAMPTEFEHTFDLDPPITPPGWQAAPISQLTVRSPKIGDLKKSFSVGDPNTPVGVIKMMGKLIELTSGQPTLVIDSLETFQYHLISDWLTPFLAPRQEDSTT